MGKTDDKSKFYFARKLYSQNLSNGKNILNLTTYDKIPTWWTIDTIFYHNLKRIVDEENYYKTINATVKFFVATLKKILSLKDTLPQYLILFYELSIKIILKIIIAIFSKNKEKSNKPKIMFISQDNQWKQYKDYETNLTKKTDVFFDSLIKEMKSNGYEPIGIYPIMYYPLKGLRTFFEKLRIWDINQIPINIYWSFNAFKKSLMSLEHFRNSLHLIQNDDIFKRICVFEGRDLHEKIVDELEVYFLVIIPHLIKYIEIQRKMIRSEKPSLILLLAEGNFWERSLLIAAKLEKVPTIAVQHGTIQKYHKSYIYTKNEISNGNLIPPFCPLPDKTVVYGPKYKEILTKKSSYPEDSVLITGQPRYDRFSHMSNLYSKKDYLKKYNIDLNKKIILWTTECHALSDLENNKNFKCVFKTIKELDNVVLIIKQHPAEGKRYTELIKQQIKINNIDVILTSKTSDTFEHIFVCDLMITKASTTAMEAIAMNKPVILLNLSQNPDPTDYVEEGGALGVYNNNELKLVVQNLLKDDSFLEENRNDFIKNNLYKIDGESTKRVMEVINKIIGV